MRGEAEGPDRIGDCCSNPGQSGCALDLSGSHRGGETWLDSRYYLKVKLTRLLMD